MEFDNTGIVFLEKGDFQGNVLKGVDSGKWFIMIQASYCGWCTKAKPEFIKASKMAEDVTFATIHVDSEDENTAALGPELETIFGVKITGIPAFFLYDAKTHKSVRFNGTNTARDFAAFVRK